MEEHRPLYRISTLFTSNGMLSIENSCIPLFLPAFTLETIPVLKSG